MPIIFIFRLVLCVIGSRGKRKMSEYVYELIAYKASKELLREKENMDEKNK